MSAWIRSVTGRAYHFEPLNANQLERLSPFIIDADLESAGCELVEETSQGFGLFANVERTCAQNDDAIEYRGSALCILHSSFNCPHSSIHRAGAS